MIHACPSRMWYVEGYLIPALTRQGIREGEIRVWNDTGGRGCLLSCMDAFEACGAYVGDTWHLQDDVIPCRDFAERAQTLRETEPGKVISGFCCTNFLHQSVKAGIVTARDMWYSFPCIRIPDTLAGACAEWFFTDARKREQFRGWVRENKYDDSFFMAFMRERHADEPQLNLAPNLVDHVDWLIGGTIVNPKRSSKINRAAYWEDEETVRELERKLKNR